MVEELEKRCDIDDIFCQMQVHSHLKGLQIVLGDEFYKLASEAGLISKC